MRHVGTIVRFADDALILCRSEADAPRAFRWFQSTARGLKLSLHPDKTRIVNLSDGADGVDFLGFHLRLVRSQRYKRWYCQRWPSGRAMAKHPGQGQRDHGPARSAEAAHRDTGGRDEPRAAGMGQLLPIGQLITEVLPDRQLRPRTPRAVRQQKSDSGRDADGVECMHRRGSPSLECTDSLGRSAMPDLRQRPHQHRRRAG